MHTLIQQLGLLGARLEADTPTLFWALFVGGIAAILLGLLWAFGDEHRTAMRPALPVAGITGCIVTAISFLVGATIFRQGILLLAPGLGLAAFCKVCTAAAYLNSQAGHRQAGGPPARPAVGALLLVALSPRRTVYPKHGLVAALILLAGVPLLIFLFGGITGGSP